MLVLGLGMSSSISMWRPTAEWDKIHQLLVGDVPQPLDRATETNDVVVEHGARVTDALSVLEKQFKSANPDVLVMIGADRGTVFSPAHIPQLCVYKGEELWGATNLPELGENAAEGVMRFKCAPDLAEEMLRFLKERGFDASSSGVQQPMTRPELGTTTAFTSPLSTLLQNTKVPIVPFYVNCHYSPMPGGHRCYELGRALGEFFDQWPGRVAVCASGGLSGDPFGPRAGWIDELLDRWALDAFAEGHGTTVTRMFELDSDTVRGSTAEIRNWIIVAGAMESIGSKASVVDYLPSYAATSGLGFACWPQPEPV